MPKDKPYRHLVDHYESCLDQHGDTHLGVDWPNAADAARRYAVMLGVVRPDGPTPATLLDLGCGASHLQEYLQATGASHLTYAGMDLSEKFVALSRRKFPHLTYYCGDLLEIGPDVPTFDYVVMNGLFTEKRALSQAEMIRFWQDMLKVAWDHTTVGLAFNVMSSHVDWQREDLFHVAMDSTAAYVRQELSRHWTMRQDYGLYEYTTYVYREPRI